MLASPPLFARDARRQLSGAALQGSSTRTCAKDMSIRLWSLSSSNWAADFGAGKAAAFTIWVAEDESQTGQRRRSPARWRSSWQILD